MQVALEPLRVAVTVASSSWETDDVASKVEALPEHVIGVLVAMEDLIVTVILYSIVPLKVENDKAGDGSSA